MMSQFLLHFSHQYERLVQFVRYVTIGAIMLVLNLLMVWAFVQFVSMHYLLASSIAFVIESVVAFFANRKYTFKTNTHFKHGYVRFMTIAFYSFLAVLIITY
jgi:putative flippase GtrA